MKLVALTAALLASALIVVSPAAAAPAPGQQIAVLKRQNAALQAKVQTLQSRITVLKGRVADLDVKLFTTALDLDVANEKLRIAETGITAFIATLDPFVVFTNIVPGVAANFDGNGPRYSSSRFSSEDNGQTSYVSYTFTWCGFC